MSDDVTKGEFQAALEAGQKLTATRTVEGYNEVVVIDGEGGGVCKLPYEGPRPQRVKGIVGLYTPESLVEYVKPFVVDGVPSVRLFADVLGRSVTAVLNDHESSDDAGYGDHRAVLKLRHSPEWEKWNAISGKMMAQATFANFIEESLADIASPAGADLLEIVSTLEAAKSTAFKSGIRLDNGTVQFKLEEAIDVKAGKAGDFVVPTEFTVGLRPFMGSAPYSVLARFRYKIDGGVLTMGFKLDRPELVLEAAFGGVDPESICNKIKTALPSVPFIEGSPRSGS